MGIDLFEYMKILRTFFVIFLVGIVYFPITGGVSAWGETEMPNQGRSLYEKHCTVCHGEKGQGDGPAARYLFPKPRDLTLGLFKVRSTPTGEPPTDEDILLTMTNGMPGSAMPSHIELSREEKMAIVEYVKELGEITEEPDRIIKPGEPPAVTPRILAKGKEIYKKVRCGACHGETGKADGPKAAALRDDWNQPASPNAFTRGIYKGGGEPSDIYLRFTTGMSGSPMPSYEDSMSDEERWAVVFYTRSLAGPTVARQPTSGKIVAKKTKENLPDNPGNALWEHTPSFIIPLMPLWQKPDSPVRRIDIKALYNDKDIAFLVEWNDDTKNTILDINTFRDGIALQFPVQSGTKPSFWMGHREGNKSEGIVNIWFWKSDIQESTDKGKEPVPHGPVENLTAGGFGTLEFNKEDSQTVSGRGHWKNGKWSVVFKRSFSGNEGNARFYKGKLTPVSFAAWDGGESEVDGKKAVSTWYYVIPEE